MKSADTINAAIERPADIKAMFNAIAPTYDTLNHVLSFGLDMRWRKRAIRLLTEKKGGTILDIAAGSGDFSLDAMALNPERIIATDFATEMLHVFRSKLDNQPHPLPIDLLACDATNLPFRDESFDVTMVAFGIRNFADRFRSLQEMRRVLKPGGIAVILELSEPRTPVISQCYTIYSVAILPFLGRIISRHASAYKYLPTSIANFPIPEEFLSLMQRAGFARMESHTLTFGTATIYLGHK